MFWTIFITIIIIIIIINVFRIKVDEYSKSKTMIDFCQKYLHAKNVVFSIRGAFFKDVCVDISYYDEMRGQKCQVNTSGEYPGSAIALAEEVYGWYGPAKAEFSSVGSDSYQISVGQVASGNDIISMANYYYQEICKSFDRIVKSTGSYGKKIISVDMIHRDINKLFLCKIRRNSNSGYGAQQNDFSFNIKILGQGKSFLQLLKGKCAEGNITFNAMFYIKNLNGERKDYSFGNTDVVILQQTGKFFEYGGLIGDLSWGIELICQKTVR